MNNLHTPALRAAGTMMLVLFLFTSFSLLAQPPQNDTSPIVVIEDIMLLQAPTTPTSTIDQTIALTDETYEASTTVSFNNQKTEAFNKVVQNSAIPEANNWESTTYQTATVRVNAYPNPVVDYLRIEVADYKDELQLVEVIGANGQLLERQNTASTQTQIDMSSLPNGNYYIRTTTLRGVTTQPIAKY